MMAMNRRRQGKLEITRPQTVACGDAAGLNSIYKHIKVLVRRPDGDLHSRKTWTSTLSCDEHVATAGSLQRIAG